MMNNLLKVMYVLLSCLFCVASCIGQPFQRLDSAQMTIVYIDSVGNYYTIYGIDSATNEKYKIISRKVGSVLKSVSGTAIFSKGVNSL